MDEQRPVVASRSDIRNTNCPKCGHAARIQWVLSDGTIIIGHVSGLVTGCRVQ